MIVDIYTTDKKYNVIYADPPWKYKTWTEGGGTAEKHYPTMKLDDIIKMKDTIEKISDNNCILFLWVTFPCLLEGLKVMKEWGFTYKTCGFNWVKRNKKSNTFFFGMGYWTRANSELCLIGTKGTIKRKSNKSYGRYNVEEASSSSKTGTVAKISLGLSLIISLFVAR